MKTREGRQSRWGGGGEDRVLVEMGGLCCSFEVAAFWRKGDGIGPGDVCGCRDF